MREVTERAVLGRGGASQDWDWGFFGCEGGMIFVGRRGCFFSVCGWKYIFGYGWECAFSMAGKILYTVFLPHAIFESLLSLLLFKLAEVSISSGCPTGVCVFLFLLFWDVVAFLRWCCCYCWWGCWWFTWMCLCVKVLAGDFFFPVFLIMMFLKGSSFSSSSYLVHSSSFLSGWSPVFVSFIVIVSSIGLVIVVVVVVVVAVVVAFWGQKQEKQPSCLQNKHKGVLSSRSTIIDWSLNLIKWSMAWNPPLSKFMMNF